jgi:sulfate-transporting ATPase
VIGSRRRRGYGDRLLIDDLSFRCRQGNHQNRRPSRQAGELLDDRKGKRRTGANRHQCYGALAVVGQTRGLPDRSRVGRSRAASTSDHRQFKCRRAHYLAAQLKGPTSRESPALSVKRGQLHLAATLLGGNVLLLDEPSNDLDVETLRALEDALLEFAGSVLVISHDRWFLDRIATHILAAEDDAKWVFFEGNYRDYEDDKKKRLGEEGARPHRIDTGR